MGKIIKGTIQETIQVSTFESRRCSRDCPHCWKELGLYKCHLRGVEEEIEKLDDIDDPNYPTADTYGFQRTDFCLKTFGNGEESKNTEESKMEKKTIWHTPDEVPELEKEVLIRIVTQDNLVGIAVYIEDNRFYDEGHNTSWQSKEIKSWAYLDQVIATSKALNVAIGAIDEVVDAYTCQSYTHEVASNKMYDAAMFARKTISEIIGGK